MRFNQITMAFYLIIRNTTSTFSLNLYRIYSCMYFFCFVGKSTQLENICKTPFEKEKDKRPCTFTRYQYTAFDFSCDGYDFSLHFNTT